MVNGMFLSWGQQKGSGEEMGKERLQLTLPEGLPCLCWRSSIALCAVSMMWAACTASKCLQSSWGTPSQGSA